VLKIALLNSVSVVTIFEIRSVAKNKQTKNITLFHLQPAHDLSMPITLRMVIEEVSAIFAPPNFLIQSVVSPLGAIENLWENAPTEGKCL